MVQFLRRQRPTRTAAPSRLARIAGTNAVESLEGRRLFALLGIAPLSELPLTFYNSTGELSYDAATDRFDVAATPTAIFLSTGPRAIVAEHGDIQIHIKVDSAGNATGVNAGDTALLGVITGAGDDLVIRGAVDLDGSGAIDAGESGVLLTGELLAFGFQDSGGNTDDYDFRFRPTGGILQSFYAGRDIGLLLNSENSGFVDFTSSYIGRAKGTFGPIQAQTGSLSGTKYRDVSGNGFSADDVPLAGTTIYLDLNTDGDLDAGEPRTVTGPDGSYSFTGLQPGTYTVREVVPSGFIRTGPALANGYSVVVNAGQDSGGNNFANFEQVCTDCSVTNITYLINGVKTVTDLRGNTNQGDTVCVTFTIPQGQGQVTVTLVSYEAPSRSFSAANANLQEIYQQQTGTFGPGTYTLCVEIPDCYYQIDFVCGLAIDRFGPAGSDIFYTPQGRLFSADNDGTAPCLDNPGTIAGCVWLDLDCDGKKDANEVGIAGVKITLTGTSGQANGVNIVRYTNRDGRFSFGNLKPGAYRITEEQPAGYNDGQVHSTEPGAQRTTNKISNITLAAGETIDGNCFSERRINGSNPITQGDAASLNFWDGTHGQNLIKALNGSSNSKALGNYLANTYRKLFGSQAGSSNNLTNKTNSQVAAYFRTLNDRSDKVSAHIMAVALATYVTDVDLAGGTYAQRYGFNVTSAGSAGRTVSVGGAGSVFGVSNNAHISLATLLSKADSSASSGLAFGSNSSRRDAGETVAAAANSLGRIS